jgi:hypothetical protein
MSKSTTTLKLSLPLKGYKTWRQIHRGVTADRQRRGLDPYPFRNFKRETQNAIPDLLTKTVKASKMAAVVSGHDMPDNGSVELLGYLSIKRIKLMWAARAT